MKKMKKVLLLVLCAALLVGATIAGTVAYLTSTAKVENTFTVGNVTITLDEAKVTEYGVKDGDTRVAANTYKLIPGQTYTKDPQIHVDANSENCFLFIEVKNEIAEIEASKTIAEQLEENGWTAFETGENTTIYYYKDVCGKGMTIPTFTQFKVQDAVKDLSAYTGKTVVVTAYAVQSETFGSATEAWEAAFGA